MPTIWEVNDAAESHAGIEFNLVRSAGSEGNKFCMGRYYIVTFDSIGQGDIFKLGKVCEGEQGVAWDVNDNGSAGVILRVRRLGEECSSSSSSSSSSYSCPVVDQCSGVVDRVNCPTGEFESQECELHFDSTGHLAKVKVCGFTEWDRDKPDLNHNGIRMILYSYADPESCETCSSVMVSSIPEHCDDPRPLVYREVSFDSIGHLVKVYSEPAEAHCGIAVECCGDIRIPSKLLLTGRQVDSLVDFEVCLVWDGKCKRWYGEFLFKNCDGRDILNIFDLRCGHSAFVIDGCERCDWVLYINGQDSGILGPAVCCPVFFQNTVATGIEYCRDGDCHNTVGSVWVIITEIPCRKGFQCPESDSCNEESLTSTGPEEPSGPPGGNGGPVGP